MQLDANRSSIIEAIDSGVLAGAVTLVWRGGQVLQVNELGHRDVEARLPMRRDTIFRIASMTKPVTVAAAMTLVDEGRLALTDPVTRWLPELADMRVLDTPGGPLDRTHPARRAITVEDLMTHRSGLAYFFSVTGPLARAYSRISTRQHPDHWLAELAELPLEHQPGERLTYSNATDVLGILLERIEGKTLQDVLAERIFGPLGMVDTGFYVAAANRNRTATMYRLTDDDTLSNDAMGPPAVTPPPFCMGGGGLFSTVDDYLTFARMLLGGGAVDGVRVLSEESARAMRTDRLTAEQKQHPFLGMPFWLGRGFGLNLSVVTDPAQSQRLYGPGGPGTFSWPGAYGTWWQADPSADLILIYLIQNFPTLGVDAAATIAGNTSLLKLQSVQPKFVRCTYQALDL
ncbi:serine hydrolase domain-containing protein [Mycolicibacterium thermoresistibile]|uniref:Beta-lactamase n=2 Tax=Mycolicibacterium thermoresistibile TaxID=1797 RepID=G7CG35_MYCT3|nr:serine hydrolase domain-containing protein [Mycolicibacterium thermoresistibile]EHI13464.1 beta-lactamase [Mycolicibacterium thermoresistibile ATCC 19527]MCV7188767.1 beta-lactamase family protein [Mycolicibacterium thermoresistibile]GAT16695.1 beta-lactamase [Mycolicibacterium thermoresistibile]SNW18757.1 beta-lactamase [Mycolicibacterium thermoresistibile]